MKRMLGFALFCFAMGMLVMIVIHNRFCGFVLMILCMLAGYYLFCCDDCQPISSFTQAAIVSSLQFAKKYSLKCSPLKAPTTRSRSSSFKIDTRSRWVTFLTSSKIFLLRCSGSTRSFGYRRPERRTVFQRYRSDLILHPIQSFLQMEERYSSRR